MSGARFVRFYPSDWRSGCIGLTLEQEGFYIRICAFIYDTDQRLPVGDDSMAAKLMGLHTNAYRKIRDQLVALGKLVERAGYWTVPRADRELAAATSNQARAQERQADQNTGRETRQDTLGDTHPNSPQETPQVFSENTNKINGHLKSQEPIVSNHREGYIVRSESDAAREADGRTPAYGDLKRSFNGTTEAMLEFIERAMGGHCRPNAEQWLASTTSALGAQNVAQAFAILAEKRAAGEIISRPLPHWSNIARGLRDRQPTSTFQKPQKRTLADALRDAEARERAVA